MESEEKTRKDLYLAILTFAAKIDTYKKSIKELTEEMNVCKEEVRGLMEENDLKHVANENYDVRISFPASFDFGMFRMDYPILTKQYFTEETITTTVVKDVYDKKKIAKECPKEYKDCLAPGTPRLTIKRR